MGINILIVFFVVSILSALPARAADCAATDTACLLSMLEQAAADVSEDQWRDNTYRELAKLLTHEKKTDTALSLISKIKNPDTQAMTIRGIGMAAAEIKMTTEEYDDLFAKLLEAAAKIEHPPSHAIALTYISMAQAFAGQNEAAMATAASMDNSALRNKAYGEAGEIQAERGEIEAVMTSIANIDDPGYKDKELRLISKAFADGKHFDYALQTAKIIGNAYQKSQAILYMLAKQITREEVSVE